MASRNYFVNGARGGSDRGCVVGDRDRNNRDRVRGGGSKHAADQRGGGRTAAQIKARTAINPTS